MQPRLLRTSNQSVNITRRHGVGVEEVLPRCVLPFNILTVNVTFLSFFLSHSNRTAFWAPLLVLYASVSSRTLHSSNF